MNIKSKLLIAAVIPVIVISLASLWLIRSQTHALAETQIHDVQTSTLNARKAELEKMAQLALNAVQAPYNSDALSEAEAKDRAKHTLNNMAFGEDGYFYVYTSDGTNVVHPRLPHLVGRNWWDLQDPDGDFVIRNLVKAAKAGGGFHRYVWNKPSTGELAPKIGYAVYLEKWDWMIGTGLYVDDLEVEVAAMRSVLNDAIDRTAQGLVTLTLVAIALAALITWAIHLTEQRFADQRLRELTQRVVEVQEDERKRVSSELHDGISQLLVSARYRLDQAMAKALGDDRITDALSKSMSTIESAIAEVRRISMALRPSVLDDIGLAAALNSLGREFTELSGIKVNTEAEPIGDRIAGHAKTALYRVAQEALTNASKHSDARQVHLSLINEDESVTLRIEDDGSLKRDLLKSLSDVKLEQRDVFGKGLGLRNMRERMDALDGSLDIRQAKTGGLLIIATLPADKLRRTATNDNETDGKPRVA